MGKLLSEMTLEELWQLFPIRLTEYDPGWVTWYREEEKKLAACLGDFAPYRMSHIGSTAVLGLASKPTVDILLEVPESVIPQALVERLTEAGWGLMASGDEPYWRLAFNKGYTPEGFADRVFHLHVRRPGDWDELYFRDYLRLHRDAAEEYGRLKRSLLPMYKHDRDGYTAAKTAFVRETTALARAELGDRYRP